jgi:hypothetical protein
MERNEKNQERGQALVIVALGLIAFLAMLALVLDGGATFVRRREAQNGADAGALAGARTLCITRDEGQAEFIGLQYATVHNAADDAQVVADIDTRRVVVTATIDLETSFAHFIGQDEIPVQAVAEAGCFCPGTGESVLPVAWACRPPIPGLSDSFDCQEQRLTLDELDDRLDNPPPPGEVYEELYIVMDSSDTGDDNEYPCSLPTTDPDYLDCDLDDDGDDDLIAGGGRSWLDLNGGGGGSDELRDWVNDGFDGIVYAHDWVGDEPGVANNVFQAAGDHVGEFVLVPVFDEICDDNHDPETACPSEWHAEDNTIDNSGGNYYYHIAGFAVFYITCVDAPGVPGPGCPGHDLASYLNGGRLNNNFKSIEGYFIEDFIPGGGGPTEGCVDTGAYTLYLTR